MPTSLFRFLLSKIPLKHIEAYKVRRFKKTVNIFSRYCICPWVILHQYLELNDLIWGNGAPLYTHVGNKDRKGWLDNEVILRGE